MVVNACCDDFGFGDVSMLIVYFELFCVWAGMGTKIHCESLFPGHHHSMRDPNNESNGCRWPLFYADNKASANDQFYNDKDVVRRTMLEHEAVFKAQVS